MRIWSQQHIGTDMELEQNSGVFIKMWSIQVATLLLSLFKHILVSLLMTCEALISFTFTGQQREFQSMLKLPIQYISWLVQTCSNMSQFFSKYQLLAIGVCNNILSVLASDLPIQLFVQVRPMGDSVCHVMLQYRLWPLCQNCLQWENLYSTFSGVW